MLKSVNKFLFGFLQHQSIGVVVRVFANGLGDQGSVPGRVIPKAQKMVLYASLLNTQHYKVWIKVIVVIQKSSAFPYTLV